MKEKLAKGKLVNWCPDQVKEINMHPKPAKNQWQYLIPGKTREPFQLPGIQAMGNLAGLLIGWGQICLGPCWTDEAHLCRPFFVPEMPIKL